MADIELGQQRKDGFAERPLITLGADLAGARRLDDVAAARGEDDGWSAADAVGWLLSTVPVPVG
jgi:hypothetical protein